MVQARIERIRIFLSSVVFCSSFNYDLCTSDKTAASTIRAILAADSAFLNDADDGYISLHAPMQKSVVI